MKKWYFIKAIKMIVFVPLALLLFGYVVMKLWNALIPELFHGPVLNFYQAIGLLILSKLFFGGLGGGMRHRGCGGKRCGGKGHSHWRQRMEEKMSKMTPEEREKFKKGFYGKLGKEYCDTNSELVSEQRQY